jgi:hypothetical protein
MASHRGEGAVRSHDQVRLLVHSFVGAHSENEEHLWMKLNILPRVRGYVTNNKRFRIE